MPKYGSAGEAKSQSIWKAIWIYLKRRFIPQKAEGSVRNQWEPADQSSLSLWTGGLCSVTQSSTGPTPILSKTIIISQPVKRMKWKECVSQLCNGQLPVFTRRPSLVSALFRICYINSSLRVRLLLRHEVIVLLTTCDNREMRGINTDTFKSILMCDTDDFPKQCSKSWRWDHLSPYPQTHIPYLPAVWGQI